MTLKNYGQRPWLSNKKKSLKSNKTANLKNSFNPKNRGCESSFLLRPQIYVKLYCFQVMLNTLGPNLTFRVKDYVEFANRQLKLKVTGDSDFMANPPTNS